MVRARHRYDVVLQGTGDEGYVLTLPPSDDRSEGPEYPWEDGCHLGTASPTIVSGTLNGTIGSVIMGSIRKVCGP